MVKARNKTDVKTTFFLEKIVGGPSQHYQRRAKYFSVEPTPKYYDYKLFSGSSKTKVINYHEYLILFWLKTLLAKSTKINLFLFHNYNSFVYMEAPSKKV